jgi:hypothetical protein
MSKTGKISLSKPAPFSKSQSVISRVGPRIFAAYTVDSP